MKKYLLITSATAFILSGCASTPKYAPPIAMPTVPQDQVDLVETKLQFRNNVDLNDKFVQLPTHQIKSNSSVVINVPSKFFEKESDDSARSQDFKTKDFFNAAEQQIERVLIRNGFRVLSRSKLEAKLRELRDETRCETWHCIRSKVDPDVRPILDDLKDKFEQGKISAAEYAGQLKEFKSQLQTASAGRRRSDDQNEMTDISEVIRAAQIQDVNADYILQINYFETDLPLSVKKDLRHTPEIRAFLRQHPNVMDEFQNGNHTIACSVFGAQLNAKLVHVKTGEIVWIGEHQLNEYSSGVQNISVELGSRKYASNVRDIQNFVARQNTPIARQARYGKTVNMPPFEFDETLVKPTVSAGRCEQKLQYSNESNASRTHLARQVAKELISTIKVSM